MKIRTSLLLLAAALSTSALVPMSAATKNISPIAYSVSSVYVDSRGDFIQRGDTRATVLFVMGRPRQELSPDVWVYSGYQADLDLANEQGCDTQVITFAQGRVVDLKLVNESATRIVTADLKSNRTKFFASAK